VGEFGFHRSGGYPTLPRSLSLPRSYYDNLVNYV
jgi:hypothetical protein